MPQSCPSWRPALARRGHFQSSDRPGSCCADGGSRNAAVIGRRPLEADHSPNLSFAASVAGRLATQARRAFDHANVAVNPGQASEDGDPSTVALDGVVLLTANCRDRSKPGVHPTSAAGAEEDDAPRGNGDVVATAGRRHVEPPGSSSEDSQSHVLTRDGTPPQGA
jgi:hypothetical protein